MRCAKSSRGWRMEAWVIMAPHDTFWGAVYGSLVDRFGVGWDLHHQKQG